MGKLIAINISEKRGTEKKEIQEAQLVTDFGIAGDAHAGKWHRENGTVFRSASSQAVHLQSETSFRAAAF